MSKEAIVVCRCGQKNRIPPTWMGEDLRCGTCKADLEFDEDDITENVTDAVPDEARQVADLPFTEGDDPATEVCARCGFPRASSFHDAPGGVKCHPVHEYVAGGRR